VNINKEHVKKAVAGFRSSGRIEREDDAISAIWEFLLVVNHDGFLKYQSDEWSGIQEALEYCNERSHELFEEIKKNDLERGALVVSELPKPRRKEYKNVFPS